MLVEFERSDGKFFKFGDIFKILEMTGIGSINVERTTEKKAFGHGDIETGERIPSRLINIISEVMFTGMNEVGSRVAKQFFNKNYEYKLHLMYRSTPVWIKCKLDLRDLPTANVFENQKLNLSLYCSDPTWKSENEFGRDIASICPMLVFPLISPLDKGFITGVYNFARTVYIPNDGDEQTYCRAIVKASGLVEGFKLFKNEDEYILFNQNLNKGDELIIDFVNGTVTLNGANAIHKLDRNSTFFAVDIGGSKIGYKAITGDNAVEVYIYYNKLYSSGV